MFQDHLEDDDDRDVQDILNFQREESEAREIVRDVSNQYSLPAEKKGRWIWEILQNARDVALPGADGKKEVDIEISLSPELLIVKHNGKPFVTGELVALFRRTSTKGITGQEGTTGKYGTGFVTTHVLNKVVQIKGYIQNKKGLKEFNLKMDRSFDEIPDMQKELGEVFKRIESIRKDSPFVTPTEAFTEFHFKLGDRSKDIAVNTMNELVNNIVFTMICNPAIKKVRISDSIHTETYDITLAAPLPLGKKLNYYKSTSKSNTERGILTYQSDTNFIIAIPVEVAEKKYKILDIGHQARFYKELPLIGTETANFPFLVQSANFRPPEPRDGLRIIKDDEEAVDKMADANRKALSDLPDILIEFFKECENAGMENLHLLAESGFPVDKYNYCDLGWYQLNVQKPLRDFFTSINIVKTESSNEKKPIGDCNFILYDQTETSESLYKLSSKLNPQNFPDTSTWKDWSKIIYQETSNWPDGITYDLESLLTDVKEYEELNAIPLVSDEERFSWLNSLHVMLRDTQKLSIADTHPIYLSQSGKLCTRSSLKIDTIHNIDFKQFVAAFGHSVTDRLVHDQLEVLDGIETFNVEEFTGAFHKSISALKPQDLTETQITCLLKIVSLFRTTKSPVRLELYERIQELLGATIPPISQVEDLDFYKWDTTDDLATRYICFLVEKQGDLETLAKTYFQENEEVAIDWLNMLYKFLAANEENRRIRQTFRIYLVQSGLFNNWESGIVYEDSMRPFDTLFKDLHRDFVKETDPYSILIDRRIEKHDFTLISLKDITTPIDHLFAAEDAEKQVREDQPHNRLFHEINNFARDYESKAWDLFPTFMKVQADLLLKAMGRTISKKLLIVQKMNRSLEELEKMASLKLPADQLQSLEKAAMQVGTQTLLAKAQEIQEASEQSKWRKKVGTRAEEAFHAAIKGINIEMLEIENPDQGCDYTLTITGTDKNPYQVEIKSTGHDKSTVKMSMKQGESASLAPHAYSLCVITRDVNDEVSVTDFIANARFVPKIGTLVKDKIDGINEGLLDIQLQEQGDVNVTLENKKYAVNVRQKIWTEGGIGFYDFVALLKAYLGVETES